MKTKRNITYIPETGDLDLPYCTGQELMGATRTVVRTLGRGMNVDVVFQGDSAYTNGETVVLPSLPDDAVLTKREGLVCGGYANHETLHNLLTNQAHNSKSVEYKRKWHDEGKKFTKSLQNGMEDVRIEHGGTQLYLGLPKAIDKTAHEVTKTFVEDIYPQDNGIVNDIKKIGSVAVTWEGRRRLGYLSEYNQKAMDLLPQHVKEWVNQVVDITMAVPHGVTGMGEIDKSVAFKGSDELHELAERIANELANGNYPNGTPIPQNPNGDGERSKEGDGTATGDGREGDGASTGSSQASDNEGSTGDNPQGNERRAEDQSTGDNSKSDGDNAQQGHGHGANDAEQDQVNWDEPLSPNLAQALSDIFKGAINGGSYRVYNRSDDYWMKRSGSKVKFDPMNSRSWTVLSQREGKKKYDKAKKNMGNQLGTMRRKLELSLVSQNRSEIVRRKRSGRLDTTKLTNIIQYDNEVFRRKQFSSSIDTAVSMVVDMSGSMSGNRLHLARDCTIAIAEALENTKVELEIVGHSTTYRGSNSTHADGSEEHVSDVVKSKHRNFNRTDTIRMTMFKAFSERLTHCHTALGNMVNCSHCANADGDAWLYAFDRLIAQPQRRKVMLCLADGYPAYHSDFSDQYQRTADVVAHMELHGVDVIGIGIQSDCVKNYFRKYVVINDIDELSKAVMDSLGKALLGQNFRVDNADLIKANRING